MAEVIESQILSTSQSDFGIEDFMQDMDAWAIYKDLNAARINYVLYQYYNSNRTDRINKFVNNRVEIEYLPSGVDENSSVSTIITRLAEEYLEMDPSTLGGLAASAFNALNDYEKPRETIKNAVVTGFVNKVNSLINL